MYNNNKDKNWQKVSKNKSLENKINNIFFIFKKFLNINTRKIKKIFFKKIKSIFYRIKFNFSIYLITIKKISDKFYFNKKKIQRLLVAAIISGIITSIFSISMTGFTIKTILLGLSIGISIAGLIYLFMFFIQPLVARFNFSTHLLISFFYYIFIIFSVSTFFIFIFDFIKTPQTFKELLYLWFSSKFINGIIFGITLLFFMNFISIIIPLIGKDVIFNLVIGFYHKPREIECAFMFLDIKSSTKIAEKIGHKKFLMLINDFFIDISKPISNTKGEIYKYVGDEAIIVWNIKKSFNYLCPIECFFLINKKIKQEKNKYLKKYNIIPEFKAGLHCGKVICGEIGIIKKEIAYMGDVLNTTARIQSLCNDNKTNLLVSKNIISKIKILKSVKVNSIGNIELRGKEKKIELFKVIFIADDNLN